MIAAVFDTLAWALGLALCVPGWRLKPARGLVVVGVIAALLCLPLAGSSLIAALRGLFAGLSVSTLVVLVGLFGARAGWLNVAQRERWALAVLFGVVGAAFYPAALGATVIDPYAWGYDAAGLALAAGALGVLAWLAGMRLLGLALVLALPVWRLGLLESVNLWDYLIDVPLALAGLIALVVLAFRSAPGRASADPLSLPGGH
ncbi:hypothetical protein [Parazoarcus communis]|uniref:Uncharacterized protein n=1 Tax=Parazoarcus communis SWub3 = DSM 12120 TaxID=1121029 RepID=A0A323V204_9RHOO|nr:hypothetical protein [Parazoarcus communis]NMG69588.1 hypothetical protein [Parazoarcus communis SWub3 = DSM 12120]PZA17526.1 hypothetical protein DNK49_06620 [Azoarcus communis] [Parazoarcus communis SWub3 = DSM 12120]